MIRLHYRIKLQYEIADQPCDFIFNLHAAQTRRQTVRTEKLSVSQAVPTSLYTEPVCANRFLRLRAGKGPLTVTYEATVDIDHHFDRPDAPVEWPATRLPGEVLTYLYPSRYCESDRLHAFAITQFARLPMGYGRVQAICDWVRSHVRFAQGSSNVHTSAADVFHHRAGVCRDFAHLMIALCRAVNIPARFTTGLDYGSDPALGPTDFHAYVEVFLSGRWYLFDPSGVAMPMGFVRIGTGRDAADVSFATIFGTIKSAVPVLEIQAIETHGFLRPWRCSAALSTDAGCTEA